MGDDIDAFRVHKKAGVCISEHRRSCVHHGIGMMACNKPKCRNGSVSYQRESDSQTLETQPNPDTVRLGTHSNPTQRDINITVTNLLVC